MDDHYDDNTSLACISNMSELPIYDVVLSRDVVYDEKPEIGKTLSNCKYVQIVPPGTYKIEIINHGNGMFKMFNSSISFRDVKGKYWTRDASGKLTRDDISSIEFRELPRPIGSTVIKRFQVEQN